MYIYATSRKRGLTPENRDITPFPITNEHYVIATCKGLCLIELYSHGDIIYRFSLDGRDYRLRISGTKWKYKYIVNITRFLMDLATKHFTYNHNCIFETEFTDIYKLIYGII